MFRKYDTIFLDRDGTINIDPGYIDHIDKYEYFPFMDEVLGKLAKSGHQVVIITNQSGVGRGLIKLDELEVIQNSIKARFIENGVDLKGIYFCTDHPDNASNRRKPGTGMFNEAIRDHSIDLSRAIMVGDGLTDMQAGFNLGIDTMLVLTGIGKETKKKLEDEGIAPTYIVDNLLIGLKYL